VPKAGAAGIELSAGASQEQTKPILFSS